MSPQTKPKLRTMIALVIIVAASFTAVLGTTALTTDKDASTTIMGNEMKESVSNATSNTTMNETSELNETTESAVLNESNMTDNETKELNATENLTLNASLLSVNTSASSIVVSVAQAEGGKVSWRIPSKRNISAEVFGTPRSPLLDDKTLTIRVQQALSQLPSPLNQKVATLLKQMPELVCLPLSERARSANGSFFTTTTKDVSEGEESRDVNGSFNATYTDRQLWDIPGETTRTDDQFALTIAFTDPDGNRYEARITSLYQPNIPGWQTGGGVVTNAWIHGITGTETPLSPRVYSYGAAWMVGDLWVNGNLTQKDMFMHLMTTQQDENKNGHLALDDQLPLQTNNTPTGQTHTTEFEVLPIHVTTDGPEFMPVNTSFVFNGKTQDFISVSFDNDTIVTGPNWVQPSFTPMKAFSPSVRFIQNLTQPSVTKNITGTPSLRILQPNSRATLRTDCLAISVAVRNFNLGPQGRILASLDFNPLTQKAPKGGRTTTTTQTSFEFDHVSPGTHTIFVQLVTPSGHALSPPVIVTRTVSINP